MSDIRIAYEALMIAARLRREMIVDRLRKGETLAEIATDLGMSKQRVHFMAKKAGYSLYDAKKAQKAENISEKQNETAEEKPQ